MKFENLRVAYDHPDPDTTEGIAYIRLANGDEVATVYNTDPKDIFNLAERQRAYAVLFAAAPKVLDALRELLDRFESLSSCSVGPDKVAYDAAVAAIHAAGSTVIEWNYEDGVWYRRKDDGFVFFGDVHSDPKEKGSPDMSDNGQKVRYAKIDNHAGQIVFSGLCPYCHGEGCHSSLCWSGDVVVTDYEEDLGEVFARNLKYVNFETALRLGKELATAARQKLEAQGVTGWEASR